MGMIGFDGKLLKIRKSSFGNSLNFQTSISAKTYLPTPALAYA